MKDKDESSHEQAS